MFFSQPDIFIGLCEEGSSWIPGGVWLLFPEHLCLFWCTNWSYAVLSSSVHTHLVLLSAAAKLFVSLQRSGKHCRCM